MIIIVIKYSWRENKILVQLNTENQIFCLFALILDRTKNRLYWSADFLVQKYVISIGH